MRSLLLFTFLCYFFLANAQSKVYIRFPDDVNAKDCSNLNYGEPVIYNPDNIPIIVGYVDATITLVPTDCHRIDREWQISFPNNYDPNKPIKIVAIPNPQANFNKNDSTNLKGVVLSDICEKGDAWSASHVIVYPNGPKVNFCTFYDSKTVLYTYTQDIRLNDYEPPVVFDCPNAGIERMDTTENDADLWSEKFWPNGGEGLADAPVILTLSGDDICPKDNALFASFVLHLDLDNDGVRESAVASSSNSKGSIAFGNLLPPYNSPKREYDSRPVPEEQKFFFSVFKEKRSKGFRYIACWASRPRPDTIIHVPIQLPPGNHQIKWTLSDACGNDSQCDVDFVVKKRPLNSTDASISLSLIGASPNPFNEKTCIGFYLKEQDDISLEVFDALGNLLHNQQAHLQAGKNEFYLNNILFPHKGIFFYVLKNSKGQQGCGKLAYWER